MRAATIVILAYLAALAPAAAADPEANKQLYRSYMEDIWHKREPGAAARYLMPNFIEHNANLPTDLAGRMKFVAALQAAFSDYRPEILDLVAAGDMLVARVQWTGTWDGAFNGRPPTGNKLRFTTADFFRIENGRFAEHWDVVDSLPRAIALGLVPAPAAQPAAPKAQ